LRNIKFLIIVLALAFGALCASSFVQAAANSASYRLDWNRVANDAAFKQSASYKMSDAIPSASSNGSSVSYNLRNVYPAGVAITSLCGNGAIDAGETCDGLNLGGNTCATYGYNNGSLTCVNCQIVNNCYNTGGGYTPSCGNSILDGGEQCDDGNLSGGDGCSAGCRIEYPDCGNGIKELGEECDDGNVNTGDGCTPACKLEHPVSCTTPDCIPTPPAGPACGNGTKEGSEKCDDGNLANGDGCSAICVIETLPVPPPIIPPTPPTSSTYPEIEELEVTIPVQEIPTGISGLHGAAGMAYGFHFESYQNGEIITILDQEPFVAVHMAPNANYEMVISDQSGILVRQGVSSDENGVLVAESALRLEFGPYTIQLLDTDHKVVRIFNIVIEDHTYRPEDMLAVGENAVREVIGLGSTKDTDTIAFGGNGKPGNEIYAYIQLGRPIKENIINPYTVIKTVTDENGDFTINIPEKLQEGSYYMNIIQVYQDRKVSPNKRYVFEVESEPINIPWVLMFIGFMTIVGLLGRTPWKKKALASWLLIAILGTTFMFSGTRVTQAAVTTPNSVIYEGKLLSPTNTPITTNQTFRFSLWKSSDLVAGDIVAGAINPLAPNYGGWDEAQSVTPNSDGTFMFELGKVTPIPDFLLTTHTHLQVEIKSFGAPDTSYELMDPTGDNGADVTDRQTIGSAPYANNADYIDNKEIGTTAGTIPVLDPGGIWNINFMPGGTNSDTFVLDNDDTSPANIVLQFGNILVAEFLKFDIVNDWFELSNDLNLGGNEIKNFAIDNELAAPGAPVQGQIYHNTTDGNTYIWNGTLWNLVAGTSVKELVFNAGYEDSVAIGDGFDNRGTLISKTVDIGARKYNFYEWNTLQAAIQDVDVQLSIKLPKDFVSFTATPLQVIYNTSDGNIANNKIDVSLFDTTNTAVAVVGAGNLANAAWTTAGITFGGAPTFNAGGTITLVIKLSTINTGFARMADVIFEYNGL